ATPDASPASASLSLHDALPISAGGPHMVATVRFRCIRDECVKDSDGQYFFLKGEKEQHQEHGKYQSLPGDRPRLYNTGALISPRSEEHTSELQSREKVVGRLLL